MKSIQYVLMPFILIAVLSCKSPPPKEQYRLLDQRMTGISFTNQLSYSDDFNVYKYRNYYNGGGVSLGDINNDGLIDVYLSANQSQNKLYLNKGNFQFEDITEIAGVGGQKAWSTGVTMVDINADGLTDIYVCNSGDVAGDNKQNELFINNGDLTFTEAAEEYQLADQGFSTHATFFDYDKDGDLDVYLLNNSYQAIGSFDLRRNERPKRDDFGGDKLMENQDGVFVDVSEQAGIYGSLIGFGLGVTIGDVNNDNWDDIFISNDFFERDYLYINQQNGTFSEVLTDQMRSISGASMGADMADLDNDGFNDLFVTEMLPSEYQRLKTVTTFEDWNKYQYNVKNGYGHQFTRNMLHRNNTNGTFSEVGRFSGVDASDWSWGALIFDMDNDGFKDLFIANGIYQDLTNQDYLLYVSNEEVIKSIVSNKKVDYKRLIDIIPSVKVPNQSYKNSGDFNFEYFKNSGLNKESFSNGAAYGDLDNDGDLDLVVNNVNMHAFVFENQIDTAIHHFIKVVLNGTDKNLQAFGSKVKVSTPQTTIYAEQQPIRGFQSSMDPRLNIGIGAAIMVNVEVLWPSGKITTKKNVPANTTLVLDEIDAEMIENDKKDTNSKLFSSSQTGTYKHSENIFVDFHRERLTYHMCSNEGPVTAVGDIDQDGDNDFVVPGAKGFPTQLLIQTEEGLQTITPEVFKAVKGSENTESLLFDADNDGDLDVYLASGGVEVTPYSEMIFDRIFFNNGKGNFTIGSQKLPNPSARISTGVIKASDIDGDGDQDLFVGERIKVSQYGLPGSGFLLRNDGKGNFTDITVSHAPSFEGLGMITDAVFIDMDQDQDEDLMVVGEFMGIRLFENQKGQFIPIAETKLSSKKGWWNRLHAVDIDQDGDLDIVAGNHGLNSRFKASKKKPIKLFLNDFDRNGSIEGVLTFQSENGKDFPYALRHNLIDQMKSLKKKFPDYESFKNADIPKIFTPEELKGVQIFELTYLSSALLINHGNFQFDLQSLPQEAQLSPIYAVNHSDFDKDGDIDLILGGNLYKAKPEVGIYDASYGVYLENNGATQFRTYKDGKGFSVKGEIRDLIVDEKAIYVFRNNDSLSIIEYRKP